jgi:hypothetical protein
MPRNNKDLLTGKPRIPLEDVMAMHADYQRGLSMGQVAKMYGRNRQSLPHVFKSRGLSVRPLAYDVKRNKDGSFRKARPARPHELEKMIQALRRVEVPDKLKREWRLWSIERRMWFIRRARERFPSSRPKVPFSANVIPFDYGTPAARELVKQLNKGRNSRNKRAQLKPAAEGVIFEGQLWYWCRNSEIQGDGYFLGTFKKEYFAEYGVGRPSLHHTIWRRHNKRKVPAGFTVICKDGNKNNLDPQNLGLRSRADCARQNIRRFWTRNARQMTALLFKNHQTKRANSEHQNTINAIHKAHRIQRGSI